MKPLYIKKKLSRLSRIEAKKIESYVLLVGFNLDCVVFSIWSVSVTFPWKGQILKERVVENSEKVAMVKE